METVERARALVADDRIRVLTSPELLERIARSLPDLPESAFRTEPVPKGTGPALAWSTWEVHREDPDAVVIALPSDHFVRPIEAFAILAREAATIARREPLLLTVGVPPDRAETGFGYIQPGEPLEASPGLEALRVAAFHEKPDAATAERYLAEGYLWNGGIFVWRARTFLDELARHAPEIGDLLPLLDEGDVQGFFERAPGVTVDVAVMERSRSVGVIRANFRWDDVGSWEAVARTRPGDERGNVVEGEAHLVDASGNVVFSDGHPVVLFGVDDLVVVRTEAVTLVTRRTRAADLKDLLSRLPGRLRRLEPPGAAE